MPKYRISYVTEDWWDMDVEASSMDEVLSKFHNGEYPHSMAVLVEGGYLQGSVEVKEI